MNLYYAYLDDKNFLIEDNYLSSYTTSHTEHSLCVYDGAEVRYIPIGVDKGEGKKPVKGINRINTTSGSETIDGYLAFYPNNDSTLYFTDSNNTKYFVCTQVGYYSGTVITKYYNYYTEGGSSSSESSSSEGSEESPDTKNIVLAEITTSYHSYLECSVEVNWTPLPFTMKFEVNGTTYTFVEGGTHKSYRYVCTEAKIYLYIDGEQSGYYAPSSAIDSGTFRIGITVNMGAVTEKNPFEAKTKFKIIV